MNILRAFCEITFDAPAPVPVVLMLRPHSGWGQWIAEERYDFNPRTQVVEYTDIYGNVCQRVMIPAGTTTIQASCVAEVPEEVDKEFSAVFVEPQHLPDHVLRFLLPSRYCPSDQLGELAGQIVAGMTPGYQQVEAIRRWLHTSIRYEYGTSNTATTASDTASCRAGVCRDFAHLGIALCRALNIPARMVVGYTEKLAIPDIHAWFEAYVGWRWYMFDGTHEETAGNRIAIAYGCDATDVAFVTQFGQLDLRSLVVRVEKG